jgi:hypothetical protein
LNHLSIIAVGDLALHGLSSGRRLEDILRPVRPQISQGDLLIGNLEGAMVEDGTGVPGKCTLKFSPAFGADLKKAGFSIVSIANNHVMDFGPQGLMQTIGALQQTELIWVGAGKDLAAACEPHFAEIDGCRIAIIARSSVEVSSQCYATVGFPGVAYLDDQRTVSEIAKYKMLGYVVILSVHWGIEHYEYPAPSQRRLAKRFIEAGAHLVIGHHPHVLQGFERIGQGLVCYSLGNFVFDDIRWSFTDQTGNRQTRNIELKKEHRMGGILRAELSDLNVESYTFFPTFIQNGGTVELEETPERVRHFEKLCSRLHWPAYDIFWKLYSLKQEWCLRLLPMLKQNLTMAKFKKIRPRHFKELAARLHRSARIASEKTTNPYE